MFEGFQAGQGTCIHRPPWNLSNITALWYRGVLGGPLKYSPIMPRSASLSNCRHDSFRVRIPGSISGQTESDNSFRLSGFILLKNFYQGYTLTTAVSESLVHSRHHGAPQLRCHSLWNPSKTSRQYGAEGFKGSPNEAERRRPMEMIPARFPN